MATVDAATVLKDYRFGLQAHDSEENRAFFKEVFAWMAAGLALSGAVAAYVGLDPTRAASIVGNPPVFYSLLILELLLVVGLVFIIQKLSAFQAAALFLGYAFLNGLTLSVIFVVYAASSISSAFFVTAGTFGAMALYGYTTRSDLTTMGNLCFMGLVGLILASIVNFFLKSEAVLWITTYAGVAIFVGLTAYDVQKLKHFEFLAPPGSNEEAREAVIGALTLYLDFVNLFLDILRIMGRKRD